MGKSQSGYLCIDEKQSFEVVANEPLLKSSVPSDYTTTKGIMPFPLFLCFDYIDNVLIGKK